MQCVFPPGTVSPMSPGNGLPYFPPCLQRRAPCLPPKVVHSDVLHGCTNELRQPPAGRGKTAPRRDALRSRAQERRGQLWFQALDHIPDQRSHEGTRGFDKHHRGLRAQLCELLGEGEAAHSFRGACVWRRHLGSPKPQACRVSLEKGIYGPAAYCLAR